MKTRNEESDVVGAVVSALDAFSAGHISWDEMNLRLHDKRYHKKPPEEDAESLVRHRNRATPLDKNPKRMLKYASENKAYYEPTLIVN